ncbi:MAG: hypothetical protein COB30_010560 [Ectothiorhodospiraceae bacterium]|nr:hypothetical protein [Ectothiorhodospiraceae bacterium]
MNKKVMKIFLTQLLPFSVVAVLIIYAMDKVPIWFGIRFPEYMRTFVVIILLGFGVGKILIPLKREIKKHSEINNN